MSSVPQKNETRSVDAFLDQARKTPAVGQPAAGRGRLIFAMDATASREPTWDLAQGLQQKMFDAAAKLGGIDVQLVYFRGAGECRASKFIGQGAGLKELMAKIRCEGGYTQIEKVFNHVRDETQNAPVGALIFVGDAMEENADTLVVKAREMSAKGVKAFMFHEGGDSKAGLAFREIARVTGGAYAAFDAGAPDRLAALLGAVAAYAAGGHAALAKRAADGDDAARLLIGQMR
jgi:hypothetical protein